MLLLETELPDELMQGGPSSWEQQMVTNKPPAQGPGPGQQQNYSAQMNGGDDSIVSNVNFQRHQQQQQQQHQLAHLLQQQVKSKNSLNPNMGQLSNKSPNLGQGGPNATVMNNLGVVSMSLTPNNNGTNNNTMSMQGKLLEMALWDVKVKYQLLSLLRHQYYGNERQSGRNDNRKQWEYSQRGPDVWRRARDWKQSFNEPNGSEYAERSHANATTHDCKPSSKSSEPRLASDQRAAHAESEHTDQPDGPNESVWLPANE